MLPLVVYLCDWYLIVQLFGKGRDVSDGDVAEDGPVEVSDHIVVAVIPGKQILPSFKSIFLTF